MPDFTHPILGGFLIGTSACLLLLGLGRIAGISGILSGIISRQADAQWRYVFISGLILGAIIFKLFSIDTGITRSPLPIWLVISAGLLVGFGSVLGKGCTSGHGVCGLGRLSIRSLTATCTFVVFAMLTTYIFKHVLGML